MSVRTPNRTQGVTSVTLAATPEAVGCSRRLVHLALSRWGLAALAEDAELVVSEIVTNSVKATGLADAGLGWADPGDLAVIQVRVLLYPAAVIIEVWDRDPAVPVRQDTAPDEEGGRGLAIVAALCRRWHYFRPGRGGKVVWAELAVAPGVVGAAGLPGRVRCAGMAAVSRAHLARDPELLRRVYRGLKALCLLWSLPWPGRLGGLVHLHPGRPPRRGEASAVTDPRPAPRVASPRGPSWGYHPAMGASYGPRNRSPLKWMRCVGWSAHHTSVSHAIWER